MVLDGEDGQSAMTKAFQGAVIQVDVSRLQVAGQVVQPDREAVVLRGNLHSIGALIEHGLIGAAMAELQFERLASKGKPQKLVAQANAEDRRRLLARQVCHGMDGVPKCGRVAGTVGKKNAVGSMRQDLVCRSGARHDCHPAADLHQTAQNVPFHSVIDSHDVMARRPRR